MKLSCILPFFLVLCVCGLPIHVILTHADGVRFTWSPDPLAGVTRPLGQDKNTMAVVRGSPMCKKARSLGPPGILERSVVTVSSPHNCPWEVRPLLFSLWFCVIFLLLWKLMLEVNTLPWFWQALSFLSRWGVEKTQESWAERRGAALVSSEERVDGKEVTAATSPAAHWFFAWSLCPGTNSPGEPTSLLNLNVLENWNDYQVATWGVSRSPGRWTWRGAD